MRSEKEIRERLENRPHAFTTEAERVRTDSFYSALDWVLSGPDTSSDLEREVDDYLRYAFDGIKYPYKAHTDQTAALCAIAVRRGLLVEISPGTFDRPKPPLSPKPPISLREAAEKYVAYVDSNYQRYDGDPFEALKAALEREGK